ncbi:MAG: ABC transporter permease [Eubacterium sp.]|nr:ABC transporter permease [Eubacterium sp.]
MNKSHKLAWKSILASPYRSLGLMTIMLLLSFIMVFGNILVLGMRNGSKNIVDKMGADIVVVPKDCEEDYEGILLTTSKNFFYMDTSVADKVRKIKGISKVSPQTFLMTLEASCCDQSAQIVGIDIASDFTITPWTEQGKLSALEQGEIIVGSDIAIRENNTFQMYDKTYHVAAVLRKSGTSMDSTVYVSQDEIEVLKQRAKKKGQGFIREVTEKDISAVLVQVDERERIDSVVARLSAVDGISVISSDSVTNKLSGEMKEVYQSFLGIVITVLLFSFLIVFIIEYIVMNERKAEIETFRVLGLKRKGIKRILLTEAFAISGTGAFLGIFLGILSSELFTVWINDLLEIPFLRPTITEELGLILGGFLITVVTSAISILLNFRRVYPEYVFD